MGLRHYVYTLSALAALASSGTTPLLAQGTAANSFVSSQAPGVMQRLPLTDFAPYSIGIHDAVPTTVLLPDIPQAFTGVGFTKDSTTAAPVFIEHTPRTTWFTVRALMPNATAELNVLMGGKVYSFHFFLTDTPHRTVTLFMPAKERAAKPAARTAHITVKRLIDILDQAKTYLFVRSQYPNMYRAVEFTMPGRVTPYTDFQVVTDMVWKFPADDTLVFRVVFVNHAETPLYYDPQVIGARITGTQYAYWKSISDLDGVVPAAKRGVAADGTETVKPGQSFGYFAITGNPDGTKANLSIKNTFDILVKRTSPPVAEDISKPARVIAPGGA